MSQLISKEARAFIARAHEGPNDRTIVASIPAPVALPEAFLANATLPNGALWVPHKGFAFATSGVAKQINLHGPDRLKQLRTEITNVFANMQVVALGDAPPAPRVFGGLAFAPGGASEEPWSEFGDGGFVLPRWSYAVEETRAFLMLTLPPGARGAEAAAASLDELDGISAGLQDGVAMWLPPISTLKVRQLEVSNWMNLLGVVQDRLTAGEFQKLVIARRSDVEIPNNLRDVIVLARLRREIPECTRFAFRRARSTFVGATPELLLSKVGTRIQTEALAGTIRSLGTDPLRVSARSEELLGSNKDLREHNFVVQHIMARLSPLCGSLAHGDQPAIRRLRNIMHLQTPIAGDLKPDADAVDVIAALHPTPAVGGVPMSSAADWIAAHEPHARGWYAAPIGWIDQRGDAMFCVALRCGLIAHPWAYVYAGAGIVTGSDAAAEYSEAGLKQMPMMLALGVESATLRSTIAPLART